MPVSRARNPPLSGTISFDATNMYVTATVTNAAIAFSEDYLAIALDVDNNNRWTASRDALLVYESAGGGPLGATWRVVTSPLGYDPNTSNYVWDCPWSDPAVTPPVGMSITVASSGNDAVYDAVIPFADMGVSAGRYDRHPRADTRQERGLVRRQREANQFLPE